jgi:MFS transporter, putative metabolite:H+ symporter
MTKPVNAANRLDRLPMGAFQWRILSLIGLGMFFDGFDNQMAAGVLGALVKEGWSTMEMNAHYISITFAGLAVGALMTGLLGDRFGRRFAYQFNLLIFGSMCLCSMFAPSMTWLTGLRFVMGIGIGAEYVCGYGMVSEFVPPQRRGWALGLISVVSMASTFAVNFIGLFVIPALGWRPMYLIGGLGALWVWFLRRKLPESPRWLESRGRYEEAEQIMQEIEAEASKTGPLLPVKAAVAQAPVWVPISVLFSRAVIARTLLAMAVCITCLVGSYSFSYWVPTFFVKQGMSVTKSLGFATVMALGSSLGPLVGMLTSDWIGRRRGTMLASLWCGVFALAYSQQTDPTWVLVFGFLLQGGMSLMIGFGLGGYTPELFATEYRFRGSGIAQMTGRIAVIGSPYIVVSLYDTYGLPSVLYAIAALYLALALGVLLFGIETNQRSLESIAPSRDGTLSEPAPGSAESTA